MNTDNTDETGLVKYWTLNVYILPLNIHHTEKDTRKKLPVITKSKFCATVPWTGCPRNLSGQQKLTAMDKRGHRIWILALKSFLCTRDYW